MKLKRRVFWLAVCAALLLGGPVLPGSAQKAKKNTASESEAKKEKNDSKVVDTRTKVDLNTASEKELDDLPGVGSATAKKIIAGRPFSSAEDLSKAGVSASTIRKITPLVTASSTSAATPAGRSTPGPSEKGASAGTTAAMKTGSGSSASKGSPGAGMVWVNTASGVYHRQGHRWYGKTKEGKYMTEADAVKAGYRPAK